MPNIDILVISHNHYDHLDKETVENLRGKEHIKVIIPLGLKKFFENIGYKNIYEFDSFNLAIVPIGAYEPKFLQKYHTTPEQAIKIGMDLNASILVAMHWGSFKLSDEDIWEPPKCFMEKANEMGVSKKRIWILKIGETRIMP